VITPTVRKSWFRRALRSIRASSLFSLKVLPSELSCVRSLDEIPLIDTAQGCMVVLFYSCNPGLPGFFKDGTKGGAGDGDAKRARVWASASAGGTRWPASNRSVLAWVEHGRGDHTPAGFRSARSGPVSKFHSHRQVSQAPTTTEVPGHYTIWVGEGWPRTRRDPADRFPDAGRANRSVSGLRIHSLSPTRQIAAKGKPEQNGVVGLRLGLLPESVRRSGMLTFSV